MIKGCFLKFIIIFTIVLAAVLYIIQNKIDVIFLPPGKQLAISIIEGGWKKSLEKVNDTPEKESLKNLLNRYIDGLKSAKDITVYKSEYIIELLSGYLKDSLIENEELSHISKIINDVLKNEK